MGDPRGLTETAIYGLTVGMLLPLIAAPLWLTNLRYDLPGYAYPFMIWHLRVAMLCLAIAFLCVLGTAVANWMT